MFMTPARLIRAFALLATLSLVSAYEHGESHRFGAMEVKTSEGTTLASGVVPASGPQATCANGDYRYSRTRLAHIKNNHQVNHELRHVEDGCMSCNCAVHEFNKIMLSDCAIYVVKGDVESFCDGSCRHWIKLRAESMVHHCQHEPFMTDARRAELEDLTTQHALMCYKEEGDYCLPKIKKLLDFGLETVTWSDPQQAEATIDLLCHPCVAELPNIVASMQGLRLISHSEIDLFNRTTLMHNVVCTTDRQGEKCFPRIIKKALEAQTLQKLPQPVYMTQSGLRVDDHILHFLGLPKNGDQLTNATETVTVPPPKKIDEMVAICEPVSTVSENQMLQMFHFWDAYGYAVPVAQATPCGADACGVPLAEGAVFAFHLKTVRPDLVTSFGVTVDNMTCSLFHAVDNKIILLASFNEIRSGISQELDLVLLTDQGAVSQSTWADQQLIASDVRVSRFLMHHLISSPETLHEECRGTCAQRLLLNLVDLIADGEDPASHIVADRLETAVPLLCTQQDNQFCATKALTPTVKACSTSDCVSCQAINASGCCGSAGVAAAAVLSSDALTVQAAGDCSATEGRCEPVIVARDVQIPLDYSYNWFMDNEAECSSMLKKDLEALHAPYKVVIMYVAPKSGDQGVIVVVSFEAPTAAVAVVETKPEVDPKESYTQACTKLKNKYAHDHPAHGIHKEDRWGVARCRRGPHNWAPWLITLASVVTIIGLACCCCTCQLKKQKQRINNKSLLPPKDVEVVQMPTMGIVESQALAQAKTLDDVPDVCVGMPLGQLTDHQLAQAQPAVGVPQPATGVPLPQP